MLQSYSIIMQSCLDKFNVLFHDENKDMEACITTVRCNISLFILLFHGVQVSDFVRDISACRVHVENRRLCVLTDGMQLVAFLHNNLAECIEVLSFKGLL